MQTNESGEGDDRRARSINEANDTRWLTIVTIVARIIKPLGKVTVSWPAVFVSPISSVARKILEKKKDGAAGCSRVAAVPVARTASTLGQPVILELSVLSRPAGRERDRERERLGKAKFRSSTSEHLSRDAPIVPFQRLVRGEGEIEIAGDKDGSILLAPLMITISSYYR